MDTVSHELRTPLTSLLGYGELVQDLSDLPVEERQLLDVMMRSAHRELAVVSDLLTMTVIDSGLLTTHRASLDLREVAQQSLEHSQVQATGYGVRLGTEVSEVTAPVFGDEAQLLDAVTRVVQLRHAHGGGRSGDAEGWRRGRRGCHRRRRPGTWHPAVRAVAGLRPALPHHSRTSGTGARHRGRSHHCQVDRGSTWEP